MSGDLGTSGIRNAAMKKNRISILGGLLGWLIINLTFAGIEYANYQEKVQILSGVLENESRQENTSFVTGYLKGTVVPSKDNIEKQLKQYGYNQTYRDTLKQQFIRHEEVILTSTTIALILICLSAYADIKKEEKKNEEQLEQVLEQIKALRNKTYKSAKEIQPVTGENEKNGKIQMSLNSLAEQIELITESARTEKEETKILVTNLSHQLKTPVAALKTSFDILSLETLKKEEYQEFLGRCKGQIDRLEELVEALIQISRMETGLIQIHLERSEIFDTILQAVNRIYPKAEEKNIEIVMEESVDNAQKTVVKQDKKWLSEAFINILENAVKYSLVGSSIQIRVQKLSLFLKIEIEDAGIGVEKKERSQIFKRFYRGQSEFVQNESGQGIGLYLTRTIIEKHGGNIKVLPAPKQGSIFVIQLPL